VSVPPDTTSNLVPALSVKTFALSSNAAVNSERDPGVNASVLIMVRSPAWL
jgi:hypothetical protein